MVGWMARALRERGHQLAVATDVFDPHAWPRGSWDGIEVQVLRPLPGESLLGSGLRSRIRARQLTRGLGPCDWIVAGNAPATLWSAAANAAPGTRRAWFCEEPRLRLHWREAQPHVAAVVDAPERYPWHGTAFVRQETEDADPRRARRRARERARDRAAVARFDLLLANGRFTAENAARVYGRAFEPCALGVPSPPAFDAPEESPPYVAWVASPLPHKNAFGMLEALHRGVAEEGLHDLRVRAVGIDMPRFAARIEALGLEGVVSLEPPLTDAGLARLVAGSRFVAYPPIDEPFGLVPLEAMALGRPVLASAHGGPAETVVHGETGWLADPLDPDALATGLATLWRDPDRCGALGRAGRRRWREAFTLEHFIDRLERALAAAG